MNYQAVWEKEDGEDILSAAEVIHICQMAQLLIRRTGGWRRMPKQIGQFN